MSEWWTYRLSDFLMFTPRTYTRLFETYNREVWPLHVVAVAIGVVILVLALRRRGGRVVGVLLAIAWLWVAWAFHWERYSTIHTFAKWFAIAFALEAILLLWFRSAVAKPPLFLFAAVLFIYPLLSARHELFAIAPDPTALGTIALIFTLRDRTRWLLLPIPLLWCAVSGATLLAMAWR